VDQWTVRRAMEGDAETFGVPARTYRPALVALGRRWFGDGYLAEELAQETLVRAFQALPGLRHPAAFRGWLFPIARNLARQRFRAQRNDGLVGDVWLEGGPTPDDVGETVALRDALHRAHAALPPEQRVVAELYLAWGPSTAEAAELLSLEPAAVKGRLQRARPDCERS